jgi:hypothetical protein
MAPDLQPSMETVHVGNKYGATCTAGSHSPRERDDPNRRKKNEAKEEDECGADILGKQEGRAVVACKHVHEP